MKILKGASKYITIFIIVVFLVTLLLTMVSKIPKKYVEKNLKQATEYFGNNNREVKEVRRKVEYTWLHTYADQMTLNIIYCLDTNKPFQSIMEAKYYSKNSIYPTAFDYRELTENNLQGNVEYVRYWHGEIMIVKPLLMIFTLEQIYLLNAIVLATLAIILLAILVHKKYYEIAIALIIGGILIACWYIPFTLEYVWTFLIMLITSIIATIIEDKNTENKNEKLYTVFFITGILTCFLDFLTTELITILVPIVIVLSMRINKKRFTNLKSEASFVMKALLLWGVAYTCMWLAKWILASLVLKVDVRTSIIDKAMIRVNKKVFDYPHWYFMLMAVKENFSTLFLITKIIKKKWILPIIAIGLISIFVLIMDKQNKKRLQYIALMGIIGIIPYIRYLALANHSFCHCFFTFRAQIVTIMCIVLAFINGTSKEKLFSKVNIKNM